MFSYVLKYNELRNMLMMILINICLKIKSKYIYSDKVRYNKEKVYEKNYDG